MKTGLIQRQENLPAHVVQICRYLRGHGFKIGPTDAKELLLAFEQHVPQSFEANKNLHKAILVKSRKEHLIFNDLFESYWVELAKAENSKNLNTVEEKLQPKKHPSKPQSSLQVLKNWLYNGKISEEKELAAYSAFEALSKKDFSGFLTGEQKELMAIIRFIANKLANKHSRRYRRSKSQRQLDLKASIKNSLREAGELNRFFFKTRKKNKVNLVLLCDVSKSMELYSQFLIEFMYGFQQAIHQIRTFVFSTNIVDLSQSLKDSDYSKVLNNLSEQVPYWSGGTRIGYSLDQFRKVYGSKLLNKNSVVVILSDGWDIGEISILENAVKHIQKKSFKLIWLNPLAGNPDYKPSTKAMAACLPYIDIFSSAHNLESLKAVAKLLRRKKFVPKY